MSWSHTSSPPKRLPRVLRDCFTYIILAIRKCHFCIHGKRVKIKITARVQLIYNIKQLQYLDASGQ
jgi:hypothetical protein